MKIKDLYPERGARKREKRIGRGPGSGHGKTATKGHKGQAARSGGTKAPGFEGGQQPLIRRVPKRGFRSIFRKEYEIVNLKQLNRFDANTVINPTLLEACGVVRKGEVKILAEGVLTKPLILSAHKFSAQAIKKIESAGGRVELLSAS
ncbi:MAG: 50S ribosomal protein L15 [Nitrospirae bacterium]|nr:50S ribosomal protein L15 [Candidatus Troglogloeales bacterium]MBI3598877.1 50S ribosomal protein L15 [Candidatus Troglogloeales bacterium]